MSALPRSGPILLTVPLITDVSIAAQVGTTPTLSPAVLFKWPGPYVVTALWLSPRSGSLTDLAGLGLRMLDEGRNELVTDGFGVAINNFASGLALMGRRFRWQPFRRVVRAGDKWTIQLANKTAGAIIPFLAFKIEEQSDGE